MVHTPLKKDFWFLPLGGSGEIGMNLNLYGHDKQWLMVDLGITFGDKFGIDIITPDPAFIVKHKDKLAGLVITHAHEDHVGAVPYLWPLLRCPIYATSFTINVIRQKIKDFSWSKEVSLIEIPLSGSTKIGVFTVDFITLTHSIPEPNALAITTPLGTVMHSGDWKIDPSPLVGETTDQKKLIEWGNRGILAMVCDSTNVFTEGTSGSEEAVRLELIDLISQYPDKRVTVACFSSNIARLETAATAAKIHGRKVCLVGRSFEKMVESAKASGYLLDLDAFVDHKKAMMLPPTEVLFITTGSQGEPRSALARIAMDQHPDITLNNEDVVIFSSRVIPGNEKSIAHMQNSLIRKGIKVVTSHEADIHVSGHPARDELRQMYEWVRPHILIPVHGEMRHMQEQADLALESGISKVVVPENGTIVRLDKENPQIIAHVQAGRLGYDGNRMIPMINPILRDRGRLAISGVVFATIVLDRQGRLAIPPHFSILGIADGEDKNNLEKDLEGVIHQTLHHFSYKNQENTKEKLRTAIRRSVNAWFGKKPAVEVHLLGSK